MNWLKHHYHQRDVMVLRWYHDSHQWLYKCCCYKNDHLRFLFGVWPRWNCCGGCWRVVASVRGSMALRWTPLMVSKVARRRHGFEGFRVKFSILRLMQLRNKWHEKIHGITFWGVRWWWTSHLCVAMQNYWLRAWPALWVQVIMIGTVRSNLENATGFVRDWRRINVAMTRAKWVPQEQVLPKAFNMNILTYWTKLPPKVGMVKKLVNTK